MFNIISRRLQRYYFWMKLLLILLSGSGVVLTVLYVEPDLSTILLAVLLIWVFLFCLLSIFVNSKISVIFSIGVSFLLFLRAVDLLTPVNLVLLIAFLILLGIYFKNPKVEPEAKPEVTAHRKDILFPKNWPFGGFKIK